MGIVISIISIKGEECNIEALSMLAQITGGEVELMDPQKVKAGENNFSNILSKSTIATNVITKVKLH